MFRLNLIHFYVLGGRLLVGLRWWNDIKTDGKSSWVFESKPRDLLNKTDSRVFWWSLYVYTIIWVVFLIIAIIKLAFMWSVIDAVAITLSTANLAAYTKCDRDAKQKLKGFLSQQFMQNLLPNPLTSWMGS